MSLMFSFLPFVIELLSNTMLQLLSIFGVFIVFGLILYVLSRYTRRLFANILGVKSDIYFTGWLGTPIHELGHAFFCIPFFHKIKEIKLYCPNSEEGTLGYVNHAYNPRNPWHQIGNFFIALGPILFGSLVIYLLVCFLLPDNQQLLTLINVSSGSMTSWSGFFALMMQTLLSFLQLIPALFTETNLYHWQFWLFLYICICVSSHMELSLPDLSGLKTGFLAIIIILLILNAIFILFGISGGASFLMGIGRFTKQTTGIFTLATAISAMNCALSLVVLNIVSLIKDKRLYF